MRRMTMGVERAHQTTTYAPSTTALLGGTPSPDGSIIDEDTVEEGMEEEDRTGEGKEDWSEGVNASTSEMSLWCGESQSNAYNNCNREGESYDCPDGVCVNGLKCFMVDDSCNKDVGKGVDDSYSSEIETLTSPTSSTTTGKNVGVLGQFCAATFEALETECATATICEVPEDCPSGTYCWEEYMCSRSLSTTYPVYCIRLVLDERAIVEWERDLLLRDRSDARVDV